MRVESSVESEAVGLIYMCGRREGDGKGPR